MRASQYTAYAAPSMVLAILFSPLGILQGIYAKHFGVALTTIAMVLLISRLFDAVTDPLVGYWSDRYYACSGSRKPFVIAGGLLFVVSGYFLYVPVSGQTIDTVTVVGTSYFLGWFLVFYLAWTLFEIPHLAWGSELASSTQDKNNIFSLRTVSIYIGILIFYLIPFLPVFDSNEFTPKTLQWTVSIAGVLMLLALYFCVKTTPDGTHVPSQVVKQEGLWALRKEILRNKPFKLFTIAYAAYGMGVFGWFGLIFIFIDAYLGLGEHFALLSLIGIISGLMTMKFWCWLASRVDKKYIWALGAILYMAAVLGTFFLEPGNKSITKLAVVMVLVYVASAVITSLSWSLLADIIDFSTWKFGTDRAATYFSLYTLISKITMSIGSAMGLGIAGWYGFDPSVPHQTEEAVFGLHMAACWLPAALLLLSISIMVMVPMDARRHGIVRRRLNSKLTRHSPIKNSQMSVSFRPNLNTASS